MSADEKERNISANKSLTDTDIDEMTRLLSQIAEQAAEMKKLRSLMQSKDSRIINLDTITEELLKKLKEANEAYTLSNQMQALRLENKELKRQIKILESENKKEKPNIS